jgi:hypothetical protein
LKAFRAEFVYCPGGQDIWRVPRCLNRNLFAEQTLQPLGERRMAERNEAMDERFNMSLRKFLKHVGVTSQQEIEKLVRERGLTESAPGTGAPGRLKVRMVLTAEGANLHHVIEGEIVLPENPVA